MNILRNTLLAAALLAAFPAAQAAVQTYSFNGSFYSGVYMGQSYSGMFSFDDAALSNVGEAWLAVSDLSVNLLGRTWTLADAMSETTGEVVYLDGDFRGLAYSARSAGIDITFVAGERDRSTAMLAYIPVEGLAGAGTVIYAPIPEPSTYAMLLAGLGMLGFVARRRAKAG